MTKIGGLMLDNYFKYKQHKTDFKTEVVAGVSTFFDNGIYNVFKSSYII